MTQAAKDDKDKEYQPLLLESDIDKEVKKPGCKAAFRRFFFGDQNPTFALDAELSFRAAVFCTILGLPFLIPKGTIQAMDAFMELGMYNTGVVFFCIFNLGRSFGETLQSCSHGMAGALIAVLHTWVLYSIFPDSVSKDSPVYVFWFGVADGVLFILTMLFLNVSSPTKIFSISNFINWWMVFLKPGVDNFHFPGMQDWDPTSDTGLACLFTTFVGAALALAASLMPYPLYSFDTAVQNGVELTEKLPMSWKRLVEYMAADSRNPYSADQVYRNILRLSKLSHSLKGHIDSSWWECLGFGRSQRVRKQLRCLDKAMQYSYDSLRAVWGSASDVDWNDDHNKLMVKIQPGLLAAVDRSNELLKSCMLVVKAGTAAEADKERVKDALRKLQEADAKLYETFKSARSALKHSLSSLEANATAADQQYVLDVLLPHVLGFNLSCYVHTLGDFAGELLETPEQSRWRVVDHAPGVADLFTAVDRASLMFAARSLGSVLTAFVLGFYGYKDLVAPYCSAIANTTSLTLNKYAGSALVANIKRVQGIVLGMVVGQIVHKIFVSCSWWNWLPLTAIVFVYTGLTTFLMNSSGKYAYLGTLAASFGLAGLLTGQCAPENSDIPLDKVGSYNGIINNILSCAVVVAWDFILSPGMASDHANDKLNACYDLIDNTLKLHFDKTLDQVPERSNTLEDITDSAHDLGEHAGNEPRFQRTDWRSAGFVYTVDRLHHMRFSLRSLESCMSQSFHRGGPRNPVLVTLLGTKAFPKIGDFIRAKLAVVRELCKIFGHETTERFPVLDNASVTKEFNAEGELLVNELMREIAKEKLPAAGSSTAHLREDNFCQVCMAVGSIRGIFKDLRLIQHNLLREV